MNTDNNPFDATQGRGQLDLSALQATEHNMNTTMDLRKYSNDNIDNIETMNEIINSPRKKKGKGHKSKSKSNRNGEKKKQQEEVGQLDNTIKTVRKRKKSQNKRGEKWDLENAGNSPVRQNGLQRDIQRYYKK